MLIIHPVSKETVEPFIGLPVVVVMKDGGQVPGRLSGFENNRVVLNDTPGTAGTSGRRKRPAKAKVRSLKAGKNKKTRTRQSPADNYASFILANTAEPEQHEELPPLHPFAQRTAIDVESIAYIATWV